jgi:hypothetical protein
MKWTGNVACIEEKCLQVAGEKALRRRPLLRPKRRWDDNIEMGL